MTTRHDTILFDVTKECNSGEEWLVRSEMGIRIRMAIVDLTVGEDGIRNIPENKAIMQAWERLQIPKRFRRKEGE